MSLVITRERDTYADAFAIPAYVEHSPGEQNLAAFLDMTGIKRYDASRYTVLDAGTGSGKGALALQAAGFKVRTCDLDDFRSAEAKDLPFTEACLWHPLKNACGYTFGGIFDYVYCTDVMEHMPQEFTMLAIARMLEVSRHGLFLSISLVPDQFGVWLGTPLHQTVKPFTWWRDNLAALGRLVESRDRITHALYLVAPR